MTRFEPAELVLPDGVLAVERLLLQHPTHRQAKQRIAQQHARARVRSDDGDRLNSTMLMILGASRNGKTRLFEDYQAAYPRVTKESVAAGGPNVPAGIHHCLDDAEYRPIVSASVKAGGDLRAFASTLLQAFGYRARDLWDTTRIITDIRFYATEMKTDLVFIDESHNLIHSNAQTTADVAAFLKDLMNEVPCQFVLAGLEPLKDIVPYAPQLKARVEATTYLRPYRWNTKDGLKNYSGLLTQFQKRLGMECAVNLTDHDIARRLYVASLDGRIGWIAKLLSRAVLLASQRGASRIDLGVLGEVYADLDFLEAEDLEGADEPDFLNEGAYVDAVSGGSPVSDADNPFLCDPRRLQVIRRELRERTDIERVDLEERIAGKTAGVTTAAGGGRVTRLRSKPEERQGAFGKVG